MYQVEKIENGLLHFFYFYRIFIGIINQTLMAMKKRLLTTALFILCSGAFTFAQVEKGNWLFAGSSNFGIESGKEKIESGSTTVDGYKFSYIDFAPKIGYFIIDKLPVGLALDMYINKEKSTDPDTENKWTGFMVGPFVRYYITDLDGFMPYAEAGMAIGSGKSIYTYAGDENENKFKMFSYGIGVGGTYFITDNVGADLQIAYGMEQDTYKVDASDRAEGDDVTYKYGGIKLNIGFVISIGK